MSQFQEDEIDVSRSYELRLLRCTLPVASPSTSVAQSSPPTQSHHIHALINDVLCLIEAGEYHQALTSTAAQHALGLFTYDLNSADQVYSELAHRVEKFLVHESTDEVERILRSVLVMCMAVAALFCFSQCNMTGPLKELPICPLPLEAGHNGGSYVEWDNWARNQLMSAGSDLLAKFTHLQYVVFANMLLTRTKDLLTGGHVSAQDSMLSISWWLSRVVLLQQRIMDGRSSFLFDQFQVYIGESLRNFGTMESVSSYWGSMLDKEEASTIVSMVYSEAGIVEHTYGRIDSCRRHFESAEMHAGLQLSITGVLGFRTVHQVEAKAQQVLVNNANSSEGNNVLLHQDTTSETSDILMTPKLLENGGSAKITISDFKSGGTVGPPLQATQQAIILAKCLLIEKSSRQDELQGWDMAPYIEAIDSQQSVYYIIQCFRDILRIRWESTRSRTKERALLMMDNLVKSVYEPSPEVNQRMFYSYAVYIPTIPALRKEYGELLIQCGLIGEAVRIFEELELWDNLIYCYRLMEKKSAAVELIKTRLSVTPNDPRLWCSLGDVTNNDACYEKALEVSESRSVRAKRSLARSAYNRAEYEKSMILWESAMSSNSLYPDGWFALGAAALKARQIEKALDGFTRAVQLDPENGEAWNNIACLHMIKKRSKESFIAFKEALKYKRNSWQLWENFSEVAMDVGNIRQALEAIQKVLDISSGKRINYELLAKIMIEMEKRRGDSDDHKLHDHCDLGEPGMKSVTSSGSRETEQFVDSLGKIFQQIIRSGGQPEIWGLYARWHKLKGDLAMCSEALLKQVRSYQGADVWRDGERFKKFACASLELCKVYMEMSSSSTGSGRELFSAEMHLKNVIKQAVNFTDMEEFRNLESCLSQVQKRLESDSLA